MKPARGSSRAASKAPNTKPRKKKTEQTKKKPTEQQDLQRVDLGKTIQPKAARKRKAGSPSVHKKVKSQENWKQMSRSSIVALENIMDLAILSTLALSQREKKEIQEHLNILKKRFTAHTAQLKVPVNKQKELECSSHRYLDETKKSEVGKKALSSLEENLKSVLVLLEKTEEETVTLEDRCRTLRDQLEEQEEEAKEMFQIAEQAVLNLPPLPPPKSETTLEARMKNIIPAADSETMARKLGEILQNTKAIRDAQELLLQAHKHADQLFKH